MTPRDIATVASHIALPEGATISIEVAIHGCTEQQAWSLAERAKVWLGVEPQRSDDECGSIYRFRCDDATLRIFGDREETPDHPLVTCPACHELVPEHSRHFCPAAGRLADSDGEAA